VATIYGYNLIHKMQKLLSWASLCIYIVATYNLDLPVFLLAVSMVATWQLAYAPYVADYSRYLPITTPTAHTFWYSYAGTVIGTIWMMTLGATLTIAIPNFLNHSGGNLASLFGNFALIMYFIIIFGQLAINVFNLYGAFMATITTIEPFLKLKVTPKVRIGMILFKEKNLNPLHKNDMKHLNKN
jgi:NCS1 family nucleobase:cation symporter-1